MPQTAPPAKPAPDSATARKRVGRNELDLGRAVDIDELDQEKGDAVDLHSVFELGELGVEMRHTLIWSFLQGLDARIKLSATTASKPVELVSQVD